MLIKNLFTRDRRLYSTFFPLLFVISAQALLALAVNLADNIMLGAYSESALAGAALVNQLQFMLQQIIGGVAAGVVVLGSQYWGQSRTEPIKRVISLGLKMGLVAGLLFWAVTFTAPAQTLRLLTPDEAVIAEGVEYLRIMCWTYLIFAVSNVLMSSLQCVQTAGVGTVMSLCTIVINVSVNYCLIFGNFGAPELGITGAAIATLISRIVELVIILVYILRVDKKLRMRLRELVSPDISYLGDYIRVSLPVMLSGAQWGVAQTAQTAILGHISAVAIAANSIAVIIFQLFAIFGMACANAASVTIGKTVGEGALDLVKPYSRTLQAIFLLNGIIAGAAIFIFKDLFVGFYAVSDETRRLAVSFLTVLSVATVGTCYEFPVESGIIAGGGDTRYASIVDVSFMWLFTIPAAALSAFVFGFPPVVTFCFLKADQILKCIPNAIVCNRYKWVKQLTR
ncbi:MAG: MATE family efflux transporter [Oscillospiraceae bacterium]|jgi:putative MATE family efflux protein|nr:MATE family efflux transporter [Oscillospiraceae bacterium]